MERMGDAHFVKLFRLAQMSIEYLIYTQNYLETLTKTLDAQYQQSYEETAKITEKIRQQTEENHLLKRELKLKQKTITTYEYLLKLPAGQETQQIKCKQCAKFFVARQFLEKHYTNHHADKNFAIDYKGHVWTQPEAPKSMLKEKDEAKERLEREKREKDEMQAREDLFNRLKNEFASQLATNLKKVEKEIEALKKSSANVEQMELRREEEIKALTITLQQPAVMMDQVKKELHQIVQAVHEKHQQPMQDESEKEDE